jgi:hypothetical protein
LEEPEVQDALAIESPIIKPAELATFIEKLRSLGWPRLLCETLQRFNYVQDAIFMFSCKTILSSRGAKDFKPQPTLCKAIM